MKQPHKGYVQTAFERRTGRTVEDWLAEHGPTMTCTDAAREIGYASPNALRGLVARYMPIDFKFYTKPVRITQAQTTEANARHDAGETWRQIAVDMGGNIQAIKDSCRRQRKTISEGRAATGKPGRQSAIGREKLVEAAERRCAGDSLDAIAESMGVSRPHLSAKLLQVERLGLAGVSKA